MTNLEKNIREIIEWQIRKKLKDKWLNLEFKSDFGMDSLMVVELVMELENIYEIRVDDDAIMRCSTPNDLIKIINKLIDKKQ